MMTSVQPTYRYKMHLLVLSKTELKDLIENYMSHHAETLVETDDIRFVALAT